MQLPVRLIIKRVYLGAQPSVILHQRLTRTGSHSCFPSRGQTADSRQTPSVSPFIIWWLSDVNECCTSNIVFSHPLYRTASVERFLFFYGLLDYFSHSSSSSFRFFSILITFFIFSLFILHFCQDNNWNVNKKISFQYSTNC